MEASKMLEPELLDPFEREVDEEMPEGEDRASVRLRCDYLLQRIREEEARAEEIAQFTARRIVMVQEHGKEELRKIEGRVAFLRSRLRLHVPSSGEGMEREFGKRSLSLPHGTVGYRKVPATVEITDPNRALLWAKGAGIQVAVRETLHKAPVLEYIRSTGEIPEGVEYIEQRETFYVTANAEDR